MSTKPPRHLRVPSYSHICVSPATAITVHPQCLSRTLPRAIPRIMICILAQNCNVLRILSFCFLPSAHIHHEQVQQKKPPTLRPYSINSPNDSTKCKPLKVDWISNNVYNVFILYPAIPWLLHDRLVQHYNVFSCTLSAGWCGLYEDTC